MTFARIELPDSLLFDLAKVDSPLDLRGVGYHRWISPAHVLRVLVLPFLVWWFISPLHPGSRPLTRNQLHISRVIPADLQIDFPKNHELQLSAVNGMLRSGVWLSRFPLYLWCSGNFSTKSIYKKGKERQMTEMRNKALVKLLQWTLELLPRQA